MSKKRYRLHLTLEQLDFLIEILETHDWLCDCNTFPKCDDYKMFKKFKSRLKNLIDRSYSSRYAGHGSFRKMKMKHMIEGRDVKGDD